MKKYRFYISDLMDGTVLGTNNEDVAKQFADTEDALVVDTETGKWWQTENRKIQVKEAK